MTTATANDDTNTTDTIGKPRRHLPGCGPNAGKSRLSKKLKATFRMLKARGESLKHFAAESYGRVPYRKVDGEWRHLKERT